MEDKCISLSELQAMMKESIEDAFQGSFWVRSEIASLSVKGNGHCYMELCQSENGKIVAQIRAIAWANVYRQIAAYFSSVTGAQLQIGQNVMLEVCVQYSALYGLSLIVSDINPEYTLGDAEARRRKTLEMLEKNGLLDLQKELCLPDLPYSLAVISAEGAAGYRDFMRHLHENQQGFCFHTELFEAPMQGSECARGIAAAIRQVLAEQGRRVNAGQAECKQAGLKQAECKQAGLKQAECKQAGGGEPLFDAVLILRGGGGKLDLGCYDEYELCEAIARCSIPVLTAVGHDQDVHLCDAVAYDAVKTPTALADYFLDLYCDADAHLDDLSRRLDNIKNTRLRLMETRLDVLQARIEAADPARLLEKGFVLVLDSKSHPLKSLTDCKKGDALTLMMREGKVRVKVEEIEKKK